MGSVYKRHICALNVFFEVDSSLYIQTIPGKIVGMMRAMQSEVHVGGRERRKEEERRSSESTALFIRLDQSVSHDQSLPAAFGHVEGKSA